MSDARGSEGGGCAALIAVVIVIAIVVAAAISLAAIVDPFGWMPSVGEIWADCTDDPSTAAEDCDLATRFPGFWGHAIVNLVYALLAVAVLAALGAAVADLRQSRALRFNSEAAAARYDDACRTVAGTALLSALAAAVPIIVALV